VDLLFRNKTNTQKQGNPSETRTHAPGNGHGKRLPAFGLPLAAFRGAITKLFKSATISLSTTVDARGGRPGLPELAPTGAVPGNTAWGADSRHDSSIAASAEATLLADGVVRRADDAPPAPFLVTTGVTKGCAPSSLLSDAFFFNFLAPFLDFAAFGQPAAETPPSSSSPPLSPPSDPEPSSTQSSPPGNNRSSSDNVRLTCDETAHTRSNGFANGNTVKQHREPWTDRGRSSPTNCHKSPCQSPRSAAS
jgi:hypothetical protein